MLGTCVGSAVLEHSGNLYVLQINLDHHQPAERQCTLLTTSGRGEELLWRATIACQLYLESQTSSIISCKLCQWITSSYHLERSSRATLSSMGPLLVYYS